MSFDLIAFEADQAPRSDARLGAWYCELLEVEEPSYNRSDPHTLSPRLKAFYGEMRQRFPALNGPDADLASETDALTDYDCNPAMLYMTFQWSQAAAARKHARVLAARHRVGLLNPQGESYFVYRPGGAFDLLSRLFR